MGVQEPCRVAFGAARVKTGCALGNTDNFYLGEVVSRCPRILVLSLLFWCAVLSSVVLILSWFSLPFRSVFTIVVFLLVWRHHPPVTWDAACVSQQDM